MKSEKWSKSILACYLLQFRKKENLISDPRDSHSDCLCLSPHVQNRYFSE